MRDVNIPIPSGRTTKQGITSPRRFLEYINGNFLLQGIETARRGAMLDLVLINKEELTENVTKPGLQ